MKRASIVATAFLVAACGRSDAPVDSPAKTPDAPPAATPGEGPAPGVEEGAAGARAVVEAYLEAARRHDADAMYALGTPEWREIERAKPRRFTPLIASRKLVLKTARVDTPKVEGDTATVSVGAVFVVDGKDDREGMNFSLVRRDGRWWIATLG